MTDLAEKTYLGVKIVSGFPMTEHAFLITKGERPVGEDREGYQVTYENGYVSWCPEKEFLEANREITGGCMPIGHAIEAVRRGYCVSRRGWGGKFLFISPYCKKLLESFTHVELPFLSVANADGTIEPWVPAPSDVLATDWETVGAVDSEVEDGFIMNSKNLMFDDVDDAPGRDLDE